MHPLTTLLLLSTSLTLTTSTTPTNASASASAAALAAATSITPPLSAASLAAEALPGGGANPALTIFMYGDVDCTYVNASFTTLTNALPLSYNVPSPQYPFWAFIMTRNLTGNEVLTLYSSTNTSGDACGEAIGNLTAASGGAGFCLPIGGATCYNLTQS